MPSKTAEFHLGLFGQNPSEDQRRLYDSEYLGYYDGSPDKPRLVAVLALALSMTTEGKTVIIVPSAKIMTETLDMIRTLSRYLIRIRKDDPEAIRLVRDAIRELVIADGVRSMVEPPRWVAYRFGPELKGIPVWLKNNLLR